MTDKPRVSNEAARRRAELPPRTIEFEGKLFDLSWDDTSVLVWDDVELAERMADEFGTECKTSPARHSTSPWDTFSLVTLPKKGES